MKRHTVPFFFIDIITGGVIYMKKILISVLVSIIIMLVVPYIIVELAKPHNNADSTEPIEPKVESVGV